MRYILKENVPNSVFIYEPKQFLWITFISDYSDYTTTDESFMTEFKKGCAFILHAPVVLWRRVLFILPLPI